MVDESSLVAPENDEPESRLRDSRERISVDRAFGQPDSLGPPPEAVDEILDSPSDLDFAIARRQKRQDRMVVRLRDRIAVTVVVFDARLVGAPNRAVCHLTVVLKPGCARRAEVEGERLIVVADTDDVPLHYL